LIAGVTAFAFQGVGDITKHGTLDFLSETHIENIAGHALVGCASAAASGGKCGAGALSGAAGSFDGPLLAGLNPDAKLVATSVVGGLASVAGGGKFANGAVTAAFGYLFNEMAHCAAGDQTCGRGALAPASPGAGGGEFGLGLGLAGAGSWLAAQSSGLWDWMVGVNDNAAVHGNSAASMQGTEVYYLINNETGAIDKIGITSYPEQRYSQAYLEAENVRYAAQAYYDWRAAAMLDENIRLNFYRFENGQLPRLNRVDR
jgi:hypothetical protein